jgi:hypothetical protein
VRRSRAVVGMTYTQPRCSAQLEETRAKQAGFSNVCKAAWVRRGTRRDRDDLHAIALLGAARGNQSGARTNLGVSIRQRDALWRSHSVAR